MESWNYICEGKIADFTDETDLQIDSCLKSRKSLDGWDQKPDYGFNESRTNSPEEGMGFVGAAIPAILEKPLHIESHLEVLLDGEVAIKNESSDGLIASNLLSGEVQSDSHVYNSLMEPNYQEELSLINLKLGSLNDWVDDGLPGERLPASQAHSGFQAKRPRTKSFDAPEGLVCQAHGCNKDLSSSKDYHKRHRVCEIHSKTPIVIVNGTKQRFCQQCSRFHLLSEFDESKRSCRRRLAGHNERRRKPRFHFSSRQYKFLYAYQGTNFLGTSVTGARFLLQDMSYGGNSDTEAYGPDKRCMNDKREARSSFCIPKSCMHVEGSSEVYGLGTPPSTKTEAYTDLSLPELPHTSCALSLLSFESHDSPSHAAGFQNAMSSTHHTTDAHQGDMSAFTNSTEASPMGSFTGSVSFAVHTDGLLQESGLLNRSRSIDLPEAKSTINLLQLSSHLQRVEMEQHRNHAGVKQEHDGSPYFLESQV